MVIRADKDNLPIDHELRIAAIEYSNNFADLQDVSKKCSLKKYIRSYYKAYKTWKDYIFNNPTYHGNNSIEDNKFQCSSCLFFYDKKCFYFGGSAIEKGFCEGWLDRLKKIDDVDGEPWSIMIEGICPKCGSFLMSSDNDGLKCLAPMCGWKHDKEPNINLND